MNYYLISLIVGLIVFFISLYALHNSYSTVRRILFIVTAMIGSFLWVLPVGFANDEVEVPYIVADKKIENINLDMKDELLVANKYILVVNTKTNPEKTTEVEVNKNIYDKVIINDEIIVNVTINRIINKAVNYSVDQECT
jgi:hypothetical protein